MKKELERWINGMRNESVLNSFLDYSTLFSVAAIISLMLTSCLGYKTPVVRDAEDLSVLPQSTAWVRGRGLSDYAILGLARIKNAQYLDLCGGYAVEPLKLTDKGFENLVSISDKLTNLTRLELCDCNPHITDMAALYLSEMPNLRSLSIMGCPGFTNKAIEYLANSISIETIFLARLDGITNEGFRSFERNKSIKGIRLEDIPQSQIDNTGLRCILKTPNLRDISFANMPFLDSDSLRLLAESRIKKVGFAQDFQLDDKGLAILSNSAAIEDLSFSVNEKITVEGMVVLAKFNSLRVLNIGNVKKNDISILQSTFKMMPSCKIQCTDDAGVYIYQR